VRELGRYPVKTELRFKEHHDKTFPTHGAFERMGSKAHFAAKLAAYCTGRAGYEDIAAFCAPIAEPQKLESDGSPASSIATTKEGYVYLAVLKIGREKRYKVGKAVLVARRTDQISIQLPEDLELIHAIRTDDAFGIEEYWHKRFSAKNTKGEWFLLLREDIQAFKKRKFM
jgi:hypothetical protein